MSKLLGKDTPRSVAVGDVELAAPNDLPSLRAGQEYLDVIPAGLRQPIVGGRPQDMGGVHVDDELTPASFCRFENSHESVDVLP